MPSTPRIGCSNIFAVATSRFGSDSPSSRGSSAVDGLGAGRRGITIAGRLQDRSSRMSNATGSVASAGMVCVSLVTGR